MCCGEEGVRAAYCCRLRGDWTVVRQFPRVRRCGGGGSRREPQMHEFAPACCLLFPMASHQSSGCSWGAVSDRGRTKALLLPHDGPTWRVCHALWPQSLQPCPQGTVYISSLVLCHLSPGKAYLLFKSCLFRHHLPMTIPFPYSFIF